MSGARFLWLACVLISSVSGSACIKPRLGSPAAKWLRVETEHFRVHTDLEPERARQQALELERTFRAFLDHGWVHEGDPPFMLNAVMFSNPFEVERFTGLDAAGYALPELLFEPWIVLAVPNRVDGLDLLRHELTHYIARQAIRHQPKWFGEGIAGYFETAHFVSDTEFEIGGVPHRLYRELRRAGPLPVSKLWKPEGGVPSRRFYATAWALVHYLMTVHGDEFVAYQAGLASGLRDEAAWQAAFPELPREKLDTQLRLYLGAGLYEKSVRRVESHPTSTKVSVLSRADRYALEGLLSRSCVHCGKSERERSRQSLALALKEDPEQLQASALRIIEQTDTRQDAVPAAARVAQQHPNEWLAWAALGVAHARAGTLGRTGDVDSVAQLMRLAPRNPYTWFLAAAQHAERGQRALALRALGRAQRIDPANVDLLVNSVEVLSQLGACDELSDATRSLSELSHTGVPESIEHMVAQWSAACRPALLQRGDGHEP